MCFFLKILWFFWICQFCCTAGVLPAWCVNTHTDTEGKQSKARVQNILKSSVKKQYLMNILYYIERPKSLPCCKERSVQTKNCRLDTVKFLAKIIRYRTELPQNPNIFPRCTNTKDSEAFSIFLWTEAERFSQRVSCKARYVST